MIRLSESATLIIALADAVATTECDVVVSYADKSVSGYNGNMQVSRTNGTTQVPICSAPAADTVRDIDSVVVFNLDTANVEASIVFNDGSDDYVIITATLPQGYQLRYTHQGSWSVVDTEGRLVSVGAAGPGTDLAVANITATTLDVTSSSGTDATLPAATATDAGLMTAADKVKVDNLSLKDVLFYADAGFNFGSYGALQLKVPIGFAISDEYSILDLPNDRIDVPRTDRYYIILHALWNAVPAGPSFDIEYTLKVNGTTDYLVVRNITPDGSNVDDNVVWQLDLTAGDYYDIWIQVNPPSGSIDLTASPDSHIQTMTWQKMFEEPQDPDVNYYARTHHGYEDFGVPFEEEFKQKEAFIIAMAAAL